ncbi:methyltransferase domain-containing protein [Morganella psychrotolerans]|uniref:methyltransferase domain-containing protein n=1 Tax=Morganella psychrotolerans TaxID=368603 RepID=UPI0039B05D0D
MLLQTVKDYVFVGEEREIAGCCDGMSAAPRELLFQLTDLMTQFSVNVLDIGFGLGLTGRMIKGGEDSFYWSVDGIDGFKPNCYNNSLINDNIYRNIWHGLAQNIPPELFAKYDVICLLDVIEHLNKETAIDLVRYILTNMNDNAHFFISTPLWFYPQDTIQEGDLEKHLIGIPASSMMAMLPLMYQVNNPLIGGFIYNKASLDYIDMFSPVTNPAFSLEQGHKIARAVSCDCTPGKITHINYD